MKASLHSLTWYDRAYFLLFNTRAVYEYNPELNKLTSQDILDEVVNFPLGFNYVETVSHRLFVCGGIGQDKQCYELVMDLDFGGFRTVKRA